MVVENDKIVHRRVGHADLEATARDLTLRAAHALA